MLAFVTVTFCRALARSYYKRRESINKSVFKYITSFTARLHNVLYLSMERNFFNVVQLFLQMEICKRRLYLCIYSSRVYSSCNLNLKSGKLIILFFLSRTFNFIHVQTNFSLVKSIIFQNWVGWLTGWWKMRWLRVKCRASYSLLLGVWLYRFPITEFASERNWIRTQSPSNYFITHSFIWNQGKP